MRQVIESGASPLVLLNVRPPWYFYPTKQSPPAQVPKFQWRVDTGTRPVKKTVEGRRMSVTTSDQACGGIFRRRFQRPANLVGSSALSGAPLGSQIQGSTAESQRENLNLVPGGFERPQFPQLTFSFGCVENLPTLRVTLLHFPFAHLQIMYLRLLEDPITASCTFHIPDE